MHRNTLDQQGLLNLCPRSSSFKSPMPLSWSHGQLFIDVGAHDGEDALAFASMGHHVLSFEPAPQKLEHIRQRIRSSQHGEKVRLIHAALSDHVGNASFRVNGEGSYQDTLARDVFGTMKRVKVPMTTLDEVVGPSRRVAFLKVDAQGYDAEVLRGAKRLLEEQRVDVLTFEVSPKLSVADDGAGAYAGVVEWLRNTCSYTCWDCPNCYPNGPSGVCHGQPLVPLAQDGAAHSRFSTLASYSFKYRGVEHGWWTDVVCMRSALVHAAGGKGGFRGSKP